MTFRKVVVGVGLFFSYLSYGAQIEQLHFREPQAWAQELEKKNESPSLVFALDWGGRVSHHRKALDEPNGLKRGMHQGRRWIDVLFSAAAPTRQEGCIAFSAGSVTGRFYPEKSLCIVSPTSSVYSSPAIVAPKSEEYETYSSFPVLLDRLFKHLQTGAPDYTHPPAGFSTIVALGPLTLVRELRTHMEKPDSLLPASSSEIKLFSLEPLKDGQPSPVKKFLELQPTPGLIPRRLELFVAGEDDEEDEDSRQCAKRLKLMSTRSITPRPFPGGGMRGNFLRRPERKGSA